MLAPIRALADSARRQQDTIFRRLFDRVGAALLIVFFSPLLIAIAVVLLVKEGKPIFFGHERVGRDGKPFDCLKFRTMVPDAQARLTRLLEADPVARREWEATHKLSEDPRVSCIGHILRRTSLDELPQLFNILRGDMSLVGPRPIVLDESVHYGQHFAEYMSVRPGMTGLWQVSGRSRTTYAQRVAMDVEYVRTRSFLGDLSILLRTVKVVLLRDGAV